VPQAAFTWFLRDGKRLTSRLDIDWSTLAGTI
jgi:hypothetical protein